MGSDDILERVDLALEEALKLLVDRLNPLGVYLFGSQASRTSRPESDLDLAVLGEKPYDPWELFQVASLLGRLVGREVDLRRAPLALQAQVAAFGQALYLREGEAERFLDLALKAYARLNEERADLIQDILKRGLVYGRGSPGLDLRGAEDPR
jgi:predicted nucleotidyltransferase